MVWSRLVEYAGRCNQTAASIDRNNIDKSILELFKTKLTLQVMPKPIAGIDLFIPTIAIIGAWREDNTYDCKAVENVSGMSYQEFESKARSMLSQNSDYLQLVNGNWQVMHKEELLNQSKELIFDDLIGRLFEMVKLVLTQNSKQVMSKTPYYISSGSIRSLDWVEAEDIHFALLDKDNEIIPIPEDRLHWEYENYNGQTLKYETIHEDYKIYEVKPWYDMNEEN